MSKNITIFQNIKETSTPFFVSLDEVLERIRSGKSKEIVKMARAEKDKRERNEIKKRLPSICFSGKFTSRHDSAITEHSGIICLDFDGYKNKKLLLEAKENLKKDRYVHALFESPSGDGLKVLVKIPKDAEYHKKYFNALKDHFDDDHFDVTSKNISRVCYESYDPLIYVNDKSSMWETLQDDEPAIHNVGEKPTIRIDDETKTMEILRKWWEKKYPMIDGQRNNNAYIFAQACNEFGVNKTAATYYLLNYASTDFPESEINRTIKSAYDEVDKHRTKYFEDTDKIDEVKSKLKRGTPKDEVRKELEAENISEVVINSVIDEAEAEDDSHIFWIKSQKGQITNIPIKFKEFLEEHGFYKFCPPGSNKYVLVRVINNLVDHTTEEEIKDFVLDYLIRLEDKSIYNFFAEKVKYFKDDFLSLLSTINIYFIEDEKDTSYLYYRNAAVKISKGSIEILDYVDLGGYVWKEHIIDRTYINCAVDESCDYRKFISNICSGDSKRMASMESTIGFLMHSFKSRSYCPAVILNDEVISDNPEGGTGKGLFMNALSQMKKVVILEGKTFSFDKTFLYQELSADTQIIVFDDVKKHFDFERLFSVITEGLTLEKKNKDAIRIPFEKSPKIAITTNYAIRGSGNSFERRKWELELHPYYSKGRQTPEKEFGRMFFSEWDDDQWCQFDNFMIGCLQGYLKTGLVRSEFVNLKIRRLSSETSHDFIEWCGLVDGSERAEILNIDSKIYSNQAFAEFEREYPDYGPRGSIKLSRIRFNKWLLAYANHIGDKPAIEGRDANGKYIIVVKNRTKEEQGKLY